MSNPNTERLYLSKKPNSIYCTNQYYKYLTISTLLEKDVLQSMFRWSQCHIYSSKSILYHNLLIVLNSFFKKNNKGDSKKLYKKKENKNISNSLYTLTSNKKRSVILSRLLHFSNKNIKQKLRYNTNIYKLFVMYSQLYNDKYNSMTRVYLEYLNFFCKKKEEKEKNSKVLLNVGYQNSPIILNIKGFSNFLLNYIGFYIKTNIRYKNPIGFLARKLKFTLKDYIKQNIITGYRIRIKGPFKASSRSKTVWISDGVLQISSFIYPVEYNIAFIHTRYGVFGVKIWLGVEKPLAIAKKTI